MVGDDETTVTTKVEWTFRIAGDNLGIFGSGEHTFPALEGEHHARSQANRWGDRPDVTVTVMSREVEIRRGPWTPAG